MQNSLSPNIRRRRPRHKATIMASQSYQSSTSTNHRCSVSTSSPESELEKSSTPKTSSSSHPIVHHSPFTLISENFTRTTKYSNKTTRRKAFSLQSSNLSSIIFVIFIYFLIQHQLPGTNAAHTECEFPNHWWGSWFQSRVPDLISITKHNISEKGVCRKHLGDRYLIENRYVLPQRIIIVFLSLF